ncbi:MAG: peptidoglycan DD-metalloendopeptidase family protein [Bacteroidota bacterium]
MKTTLTFALTLWFCTSSYLSFSQNIKESLPESSGYLNTENNAVNPCISKAEYQMLDKDCAANIKRLGLDKKEKSTLTTLFNWPLRAATGFNDCSFYIVTAYVDENLAAGAIGDYFCGTNTYDTHQGTDICTWPFPFYKMDHSQVEVIAAAPGTIISKSDGNFDRYCSSNTNTANYVIIQHADGSCALYWHMKSGAVTTKTVGQTVVTGEYLGVVGSSGSSSGPHLHFEVWSGTTSATYKDPFSGTCNVLNANSWWAAQKPHTEPAILKASVHTTDIKIPGCDTTETPNESSTYTIPFQGPGLSPGYAKFYVFIRNEVSGTVVNCSILNPGGSIFNSWNYNVNGNYNGAYFGFSKLLPTTAGVYTFQAVYNGITCAQTFTILTATGTNPTLDASQFKIYPNPANDIINVAGEGIKAGDYTFRCKNVLGQTMFEEKATFTSESFQKTFSVSALARGIYFLTIENKNGSMTEKIVKEN